jgi:hypothetical protein
LLKSLKKRTIKEDDGSSWAFNAILGLLQSEKERAEKKEHNIESSHSSLTSINGKSSL